MARQKKTCTDEDRRTKFLEELAESAHVTASARRAGIARRTLYNWRDTVDGFAAAWDAVLPLGVAALEDEAVRRAFHGTLKPVYQGGKKVGTVREFSDPLLIFMLKSKRPDVYRDNSRVEVAGDPSAPVKHEHEHSGTVTAKIEQYTAAFEGVANRAGEGGPPGDRPGEPVDP